MRRLLALLLLTATAGCDVLRPMLSNLNPIATAVPTSTPAPTPTALPATGVQFTVHVPANTPPGSSVVLVIVDEVTGNGLNDQKVTMGAAGQNVWSVIVNLPMGGLLKYKYIHEGQATAPEASPDSREVHYRTLRVTLSAKVEDTVAGWTDAPMPPDMPLGSLTGIIRNFATGQGVAGLIVSAGGLQTLTTWDGSYAFPRLPHGAQRVTALAPDGAWTVAEGATVVNAPVGAFVDLGVDAARPVNVTFVVSIPTETDARAPVRLAGNALQLGNTFASSQPVVADRLVTLVRQADGRWAVTVPLYEGMDVHYRYTLGDGFWNAELALDGSRPLRELVVPGGDIVLSDSVAAWRTAGLSPVTFGAAVPADTPPDDTITIQFKVAGVSNPIPMWPDGLNRWRYVLYNPLNLALDLGYRYCRNSECGVADDASTVGANPVFKRFLPTVLPVDLEDTVAGWRAWSLPNPVYQVVPPQAPGRPDMRASFELGEDWHGRWLPRMEQTLNEIAATGATHLTLDSLWITDSTAPAVRFDFEASPLPADVAALAAAARARNLKIALRPITCRGPRPDCGYWSGTVFSVEGWGHWFETYRNFLLYHADLAERIGADMLYVGDYSLHPMLPGAPEASPEAETQWRALIDEVRQHYHGQLAFTVLLQDAQTTRGMPLFGDALDYIDVRWEAPLAASNPASLEEMQATAGVLIDTQVFEVFVHFNKPLGISARLLSVNGTATQCIAAVGQPCRAYDEFTPGSPDEGGAQTDLNQQAMAYHALLSAVNDRGWISGFNAWGYYPPVALRDRWLSVRGKPAEAVISAWYHPWTGR
jgi:hypothetical protein